MGSPTTSGIFICLEKPDSNVAKIAFFCCCWNPKNTSKKTVWSVKKHWSSKLLLNICFSKSAFSSHIHVLIGVLCLNSSLNKQHYHSSLVPIPSSLDSAGASLSVITSLSLETRVIVLSVTRGSLKGGHCVDLGLQFSERLSFRKI